MRKDRPDVELEEVERPETIHTVFASEWVDDTWKDCAPGRPALASTLALFERAARGLSGIYRVLRADRQLQCYRDNADDRTTVSTMPTSIIGDLEAGQTAIIAMLEREIDHLRDWLGEHPLTEPANVAVYS